MEWNRELRPIESKQDLAADPILGVVESVDTRAGTGGRSVRVTWLQPVEHENLGGMDAWFNERGHKTTQVCLYRGEALPLEGSFDLLIVLGGGMFPTDEHHYPWLRQGLELMRSAALSGRYVLGICLGAQLLARAFGGEITQNDEAEIGWHPVQLTTHGSRHPVMRGVPPEFVAFHWHQDVASVPPGAALLAESAACRNQAFSIGCRALGVQFHPEITERKATGFAQAAKRMTRGPYIQSAEIISSGVDHFAHQSSILDRLLENLLGS
jgi:GMP synthase-like glutamine amidotransferase